MVRLRAAAELLLFVEGHAVDRLPLGVLTLRSRRSCLAIGGNDDGLHDRLLAGQLRHDPDGIRVDARDGEGIAERRLPVAG